MNTDSKNTLTKLILTSKDADALLVALDLLRDVADQAIQNGSKDCAWTRAQDQVRTSNLVADLTSIKFTGSTKNSRSFG